MIKQLFCSHEYKVLSEHTETYEETAKERVGAGMYAFTRTLTDFWGRPYMRTRTAKTVILTCDKCGKTKTEVL